MDASASTASAAFRAGVWPTHPLSSDCSLALDDTDTTDAREPPAAVAVLAACQRPAS